MYSELWNNQRRLSSMWKKRRRKKIEAPYRLCFHSVPTHLLVSFSSVFLSWLWQWKETRLVRFAQQHLTVSWIWHRLQCYRESVVTWCYNSEEQYTPEQKKRKKELSSSLFGLLMSINIRGGGRASLNRPWAPYHDSYSRLVCSSSMRLA